MARRFVVCKRDFDRGYEVGAVQRDGSVRPVRGTWDTSRKTVAAKVERMNARLRKAAKP